MSEEDVKLHRKNIHEGVQIRLKEANVSVANNDDVKIKTK